MVTSPAQQTADMLDWIENHGYVVESGSEDGRIEFRAKRRAGQGWLHVGRCDTGDGELHAYHAALQLAHAVATEIEQHARKPRRSRLAAFVSRLFTDRPRDPRPRTA